MEVSDDVSDMYSLLKQELEAHGEVMVTMDSGETVELHLGNTTFDEPREQLFTVKGHGDGQETRYYDGDKVESVRLHYDL